MDASAETRWFYNAAGERKGPLSKDQIAALLGAGVLNEHSQVWSTAVSGWTALYRTDLKELLAGREIAPPDIPEAASEPISAAPVPLASGPATLPPAQAYPAYDNKFIGLTLGGLLYLNFAIQVLQFNGIVVKSQGMAGKIATVRLLESPEIAALLGIPILIAAVLFLVWVYRATANAVRLAGPQSITPWGAVYWYFVPVFWFWKPYEAMRNLHDAFIGTKEHRPVIEWWTFWIANFGLMIVAAIVAEGSSIDATNDQGVYVFWTAALAVSGAASFFFAARLVFLLVRAEAAKRSA